jgi:hypothetical protein
MLRGPRMSTPDLREATAPRRRARFWRTRGEQFASRDSRLRPRGDRRRHLWSNRSTTHQGPRCGCGSRRAEAARRCATRGGLASARAQVQAKDEVLRARDELEKETRSQRREIQDVEKKLGTSRSSSSAAARSSTPAPRRVEQRERSLQEREASVDRGFQRPPREVGASAASARARRGAQPRRGEAGLLEDMTGEVKLEAARRIRQIEEEAKSEGRSARERRSCPLRSSARRRVRRRADDLARASPERRHEGPLIGREGRETSARSSRRPASI